MIFVCLVLALTACARSEPRPALEELQPAIDVLADALGGGDDAAPLVTGQACEEVEGAVEEAEALAQARIPLVPGLTLASTWVGANVGEDNWDHECLMQVTEVSNARVVLLVNCPDPDNPSHGPGQIQVCRKDLRSGTMYRTGVGPNVPDLVAGSTKDVLSHATFRALRAGDETPLRHLQLRAPTFTEGALAADPDATINVEEDLRGTLSRTDVGTLSLAVNDTVVALPVVHASASLRGTGDQGGTVEQQFTVLDDSLLPLVLDVRRPRTGAGIRYLRITWPQPSTIERELAEERTSTVYGIWFDYNSAAIRAESEAVLRGIAQVLQDHPDWTLRIEGHTDSIGGAAYNQALSERRAAAVRSALVAGGATRHRWTAPNDWWIRRLTPHR